MKNIYKVLLVFATTSALATGCIKETFPEGGSATTEQVAVSPVALKASVDGLVAQTYQPYFFYGSSAQREFDMSYAGILLTLSRLTCDFVVNGEEIGYDWWGAYTARQGFGYHPNTYQSAVPFMTLYKMVKSANDIISTIGLDNIEGLSDEQKQYLGIALTYRALMYYDVYCLYQPAVIDEGVCENYKIDEDIVGLTGPIILTAQEGQSQYKTARAPKEAMAAQILSDLDLAEQLFTASPVACGGIYPSLPVVYGIKARLYLAEENWDKAAEFAQLAIDESGKTPMNNAQLHNPTTAFAKHSADDSWMWYYVISGENMGNLCNIAGFIAGENDWGYNSLTQLAVQKWIYDNINYTDIRKTWFIDPNKKVYPEETYKWASSAYLEDYPFASLPNYMCFKFRCKDGDWKTYNVGGAIDFPIMRVEEMHLILAEAKGMQNGGDASYLENFIRTYRDPEYSYGAKAAKFGQGIYFVKNFQEEVFFQKRVEFLGEGVGFFDAKRLRVGIHTDYPGTNVSHAEVKYNFEGASPFWNFTIPNNEVENNEYIIAENEVPVEIDGVKQTKNNPDPTGSVKNTVELPSEDE